jgi:CheY-like chemotaxis protein
VASVTREETKALSLGADAFLQKPVGREALSAALERVAPRAPQRVALIIDDDAAARYVIRHSVKRRLRFEEASDGESGLALAQSVQPGVIFLDLSMPGMQGDEVLERLKADPATAHIPVIIVTSGDIDTALRTRLSGRARAIVQKRELSVESLGRALEGLDLRGVAQ